MTTEDIPEPRLPLETPRLLLRAFRAEDHDDIHAYAVDPRVYRSMTWGPNTPEMTAEVLRRRLDDQRAWPRPSLCLGLELKSTGSLIGSIELKLFDPAHRTAELGYCMAADHWRQGLMSEAAGAVVAAAFRDLSLHRVIATCDVHNVGSWGVMEKIGMRREGLMQRNERVRGAWRDSYLYAVLAEEHQA